MRKEYFIYSLSKDYFRFTFGSDVMCNKIYKVRRGVDGRVSKIIFLNTKAVPKLKHN